MEIRFVSTLTPDEENRIAAFLLDSVKSLLDRFPLTYSIRITTSDARVFQYGRSDGDGRMVTADIDEGTYRPATHRMSGSHYSP